MIKIFKGKYKQNIKQYQVIIFIQHHPFLPGHMCPPCLRLFAFCLCPLLKTQECRGCSKKWRGCLIGAVVKNLMFNIKVP
jgi:hypothetical protein